MKITLNTSHLYSALSILERETRNCEITNQSKDIILIETRQDHVYFTASTKYSALCRIFRTPESNLAETCLVELKDLIRAVENFSRSTAVRLVLSQERLIVKGGNYSPVLISCRNLDFWPHKTFHLNPIFQLPEKFPVWLKEAWRFMSDGDTIATQKTKIWLTSRGIIVSREKVFLHISFNCAIRTPVFLPPPPVFLEVAPDKPTFISKGVVTGHGAKERSVAFALESFSWSWIIFKPSEWIAGQIPKVPTWKRDALCSIQLTDGDFRQCNEITEKNRKEDLEWEITPQVVYRTTLDNEFTIHAAIRIGKPPVGIRFHLPSEMLGFMRLMRT